MKKILFIFTVLIVSFNAIGQKPTSNTPFVRYGDDSTKISFGDITFSSSQLPDLIKIFNLADKLVNYCDSNPVIDSLNVSVSKVIGYIGKYRFTYLFNTSPEYSFNILIEDVSPLLQNSTKKTGRLKSSYFHKSKPMFSYYLTEGRNEYYRKLKIYNNKIYRVNREIDSICAPAIKK